MSSTTRNLHHTANYTVRDFSAIVFHFRRRQLFVVIMIRSLATLVEDALVSRIVAMNISFQSYLSSWIGTDGRLGGSPTTLRRRLFMNDALPDAVPREMRSTLLFNVDPVTSNDPRWINLVFVLNGLKFTEKDLRGGIS